MNIPVLSNLFYYFRLFFKHTGFNLVWLIIVVSISGIVSGLGLSAIIPLINLTTTDTARDDIVSKLFSKLFEYSNIDLSLRSIVVLIIVIFLFKAFVDILQSFVNVYLVTKLARDVRSDLISKHCSVNYKYFVKTNIGQITNIISIETQRFVASFKKYVSFISFFITGAIYSIFSVIVNYKLALVIFCFSIMVYLSLFKIRKYLVRLSILLTQVNSKSESLSIQFLYNFKYLKATAQTGKLARKLFGFFSEQQKITIKSSLLTDITRCGMEFASLVIVVLSFYYFLEFEKQSLAHIAIPLLFAHRIFSSFNALQIDWQKFLNFSGSIIQLEKVNKSLILEREKSSGQSVPPLKDSITLRDVNFFYNKRNTINNLSLDIPKNTSVGIAGKSGSGKTTLLDIVTGLLDPTSGCIFFDGKDYSKIDKASLRGKFGYITQEPIIFNDTIKNNITLWQEDIDGNEMKDQLDRATSGAHCKDFINEKEHGLDEVIGDKGVMLSGGQRQRVCIAREIFRDKDILIFDEATASLDTTSEKYVQKSIRDLAGKKTMIIVAHRLSTLRYCDVIYVFENGSIVEQGSWKDLSNDVDSIFYEMLKQQSVSEM